MERLMKRGRRMSLALSLNLRRRGGHVAETANGLDQLDA
jgi:hypothetical protein